MASRQTRTDPGRSAASIYTRRFLLEPGHESMGNMGAQRLIRTILVTRLDHVHDARMFGLCDLAPSLSREGRRRHQRHGPIDKIKLLHQIPIVRSQMNLAVKAAVVAGQRRRIAHQCIVGQHHFAQHAHFFGRSMTRGQTCCKPFQLAAHHIKLCRLVVIQRCDDQAATLPRQQGLGFKPLQCLADGCAGHLEPFRQFTFHQPVTGTVGSHIYRLQYQAVGVSRSGFRCSHVVSFFWTHIIARDHLRKRWCASPLAGLVHRPYQSTMPREAFSHVDTWVFDLDNTLYPPTARLFDLIEVRMTAWVMSALNVEKAEADRLRLEYWQTHGTTLAGLMREHDVDPGPYLDDVHDISMDSLTPDADLAARIANLPGRRIVYTNGCEPYARRVLEARGLEGMFDAVYGVEHAEFHPKPDRSAFDRIFALADVDPTRSAMFEDDPRNLEVPFALGMKTVHVAPLRRDAAHIEYHTDDLGGFLQKLTA